MGDMNVASSVASNLTNVITNYSVDGKTTDAATGHGRFVYHNSNRTQQLGYYKKIPELQAAIDGRAEWAMGKGFEADEATTMLLMTIKGKGNQSFNSIIETMIRDYYIGGDAFAEIIREDGNLINLKILDPDSMGIVSNAQGMITGYEQNSKTNKTPKKYDKDRILHFSRNVVADEVHGTSVVDACEWIILARNEAMADERTLRHRFVVPRWIIKLDTDDKTKIATEKAKWDLANKNGENMYVPMGAVEVEQMGISPNATLNNQSWIESLNNYFYETVGTPKIIIGNSQSFTEGATKMVYLAFEQRVKKDQLYVEEQLISQLNIVIDLVFPASLENEVLAAKPTDEEAKEGPLTASEPNDTTAEAEGNR